MRARFATLLLPLAACSGWVDPNDFYLPPDRSQGSEPVLTQRTSRHPETGELAARWTVLSFPDGRVLKNGSEERFHPDGSPAAVRGFDQGRPQGDWRTWYPDGTLRSEYTFGPTATPQRFYHPSGQPSAAGPALAGRREGPWTFWFEDGQVRQAGEYRAGHEHGVWTLYWEHGGLRSRGWFVQGQRMGEWKHWKEQPRTAESDWAPPALPVLGPLEPLR